MFRTEYYSSNFMIMSFWAPALKSPAENGIPKKSLDMSLTLKAIFNSRYSNVYQLFSDVENTTCSER